MLGTQANDCPTPCVKSEFSALEIYLLNMLETGVVCYRVDVPNSLHKCYKLTKGMSIGLFDEKVEIRARYKREKLADETCSHIDVITSIPVWRPRYIVSSVNG